MQSKGSCYADEHCPLSGICKLLVLKFSEPRISIVYAAVSMVHVYVTIDSL